ncbi:MAG: HicB family protein [Alphaproteobacteria bacterium CG_4_9_14_3_um_filter_47_13]|nr:MAG: HicB family protein [Alphaproteobacteria bacterium CG_4_9_14_3_um_filter_47_13]
MTTSFKYIALVRKEDNTDYWVDIPDLPGCVSYGDTIDDAMANFQEALDLHLESIRKSREPLPIPRSKEDVLGTEEEEWLQAYWVQISNDDMLHTVFQQISR